MVAEAAFRLLVGLTLCIAFAAMAAAGYGVAVRRRLGEERRRGAERSCEAAALRGELERLEAAVRDRDRAAAASEAKSRFLATVSHEIRTPLSGVLGLAGLLQDTSLSREQHSYVAAIKTSGQALIELLDDILDFARIEAGRVELTPGPFDVVDMVEGVVELLAPRAQGKGLEIATFVSAEVPRRLFGDANRLRQILLNLAGNAVKFTERGGVGVAVARRRDGAIVFSVSDTGPGVPVERRDTIFEDFEQADGSTSRRHGGVGLGLAITRRLVGLMGGELGLETREGGGALFAFAINLDAVAGSPGRTDLASDGKIKRALVVSSEVFQPAYIAGALAELGTETARVASFSEAAALIRQPGARIDLLLVDCGRGEDEARALAAMARLAGIPRSVLLFSPFQRRAVSQHVLAGFDAWLVKPVRRDSLTARLADSGSMRSRSTPVASPGPGGSPAPRRVLLAEDNAINAMIARTLAERAGATVVHAEDGAAAVAAAEAALREHRPFDLVLMDVCMPAMDGLEATRRIRAAEGRHGRSASMIVAMTARTLSQTAQDCSAAGMDLVLTKPIDPAALQGLLVSAPGPLASAS